jgi:hypothetical protein
MEESQESQEKAFSPVKNFSIALAELKKGAKIARQGWNGKDMYLVLKPGYPSGVPANEATAKAHGIALYTMIKYSPYIEMMTATGEIVPWLASQTDLLAEDWIVL